MYRAITLLETLISLTVLVIAIYFISPFFLRISDPILVANEVENIKAFLIQIQSKARYTNQNYAVSIAQKNKVWCIIAIAKNSEKQTACNCLNIPSCMINSDYALYKNTHPVSVYNKNLYPKIFTYFDGKSGNQSTVCLNISTGNEEAILQIQRNGVINVIQGKTRSQCQENPS